MLHLYLYFFKHQQALLLAHWFPCFLPSRIPVDSITVSSTRHLLNLFSFLLFRSKIKSIYSAISSNSVFFLGKYSIYILFSLLQICHIFTCYIMPFCFILQICHIHVLLNKWILNLNFSYTSTDKVRFLYSHGKFVKKKVCMDPFKNSQPSSTRIPWHSLPQFCPSLFFFLLFLLSQQYFSM